MRECLEETGYAVKIVKNICSAEMYTRHPQMGYFHPIQNYYYGELLEQKQEATEADHSLQWIDYDIIKGHMFLEMQNWALEKCWLNDRRIGMENPIEQINNIANLDDFLTFIVQLAMDAKEYPEEWKNTTITDYLGQMASWVDDCSMFDNTIDWEKIDYRTFAKILYMGKIYE